MNRNWPVLVLILAALTGEGGATQSAAPGRVIWRGVMTEMTSSPSCEEQVVQTFEFEGDEREGETTWRSRKVTWNQGMTCAKDVLMFVDDDGDATTPPRRKLGPWSASCENKGEADLQSTPDPSVRSRCQETPRLGFISARTLPTLGWTGPRPDDQMRDGCTFNTRSRTLGSDGTVGLITVSITVSRGHVDASVDVDRREYDAFVPEPGKTLTFTARSARPARFRFELERDGTSRFPGYATNANVDDVFFLKHNLTHLRGQYANDGADMIFDPERFSSVGWSRRDLHFVETRAAEMSALVPVTAMDYGAVGRLRAYVESADCGGSWQPIKIVVNGQPRDAIDIPVDADNNLIADALEQYRGLDSGADDDAEPKGNGMAGDGLTAFEEYRGFVVRGASCPVPPEPVDAGEPSPEPFPREEGDPSDIPGVDDEYLRTVPQRKDLFVHTLDAELGAGLRAFAWSTDLKVHAICERHYVDNDTRIVNFTLQAAGMRTWRSKRVSQDEPQHGLYMLAVDFRPREALAIAIAVDETPDYDSGLIGPPRFVRFILVYKRSRRDEVMEALNARRAGRPIPESVNYTPVVMHELGHAVGIPHHGDSVENWRLVFGKGNVTARLSVFQRAGLPLLTRSTSEDRLRNIAAGVEGLIVVPGTDCPDVDRMHRDGQFAGCWAGVIARRGQQNSGNFHCPMRYAGADWYEPPGSTANYLWTDVVTGPTPDGPDRIKVDAWGGNLLRYDIDRDREFPMGKLCTSTRGTEINALPGSRNHNGNVTRVHPNRNEDAGHDKPCVEFLVVNDVATRGFRWD